VYVSVSKSYIRKNKRSTMTTVHQQFEIIENQVKDRNKKKLLLSKCNPVKYLQRIMLVKQCCGENSSRANMHQASPLINSDTFDVDVAYDRLIKHWDSSKMSRDKDLLHIVSSM
jgi:hypothetical protein